MRQWKNLIKYKKRGDILKNIIIIGAGDFGREVAWLINDINKVSPVYKIIGYLDDDSHKSDMLINGYPVLGKIKDFSEVQKKNNGCAVIALQNGDIRQKIAERYLEFNDWETLIHPSVNISGTSTIGKGCIFCAGTNVSVNTIIGSHCIFNISSTVGHDGLIEDYVSVMSGARICGHVTIHNNSYIATNSSILPQKTIGEYGVVGAGSVVVRNVKPHTTVMGVPAKRVDF